MSRSRIKRSGAALAAIAALVLVAGAGAASGPVLTVGWQAPTLRDGQAFTVRVGEPVTFNLAAASSQRQQVLVVSRKQPAGARFTAAYGKPGVASLTWTPAANQTGEHLFTFTAQTRARPHAYAHPRTFFVFVLPDVPNPPNTPFSLTGSNGMSRWAPVLDVVSARARPSAGARAVGLLRPETPEQTQNIAVALNGLVNEKGEYWVQVRLPILPNGTTGWVPRTALGGFTQIWTHLVIDRALFTATLYREGAAVFRSRVGVGKPHWPTPAGEFYVRERITGFTDLIYGPLAFGTNGRSAVLTDWPGGGFIGIHGTNQPEILPGRVSHGCVRMPNAAIKRLAQLMPLGTPVTIL